ncbi:OTU-domain-containing protein [Acrodontium crateriforme]|uniref:Ubiquitin thioesterase OTU n=1 Tax=Acrodontium crateriforme TaxID=150365 RepID=A0AAQ3R1U3_9PEZI|nr:OTU-domain-containing protein [Acrodontium crateriforme]
MRLRVRGPQGVATIALEDSASWSDLRKEIVEKTGVSDFDVKFGYPPQALATDGIEYSTRLSEFPVKLNGEQLIITPRHMGSSSSASKDANLQSSAPQAGNVSNAKKQAAASLPNQPLNLSRKKNDIQNEPPEIPVPLLGGIMVLRVMPDDNSCMFRALSSAVLGPALDGMTELRSVVAQTIQANPELYTRGLLEKEPSEYCRWIQRVDSWGGGIELSILSQHFDIEICSINVQDTRIDRFNEGKSTRCILVYSGIHYDVCALTPCSGADPEFDRKVFDVVRMGDEETDDGALEAARELCTVLKSRHYFTDTKGFDLKCNTCGQAGKGEKWAVEHASRTGHSDFGEA